MKSFKLNDIEKRTLTQQNELAQISEYGWRNLNVVRLNPSKNFTAGDTEIQFQLDSSLLASNVPINRIQMEIDYEVIATSTPNGISGVPIYYKNEPDGIAMYQNYPVVLPAGTNFAVDPTAANSISFASYLTSPSNGGLDFLVGNKSFSNIKIKNGANELRDDKRSAEKIDIMSRLLSTEKMAKEGVHADYEKSDIASKAGGDLELLKLIHQPFDEGYEYGRLQYTDLFPKGCSPRDTLDHNIFWKRNTNQQYIDYGNTYFKKMGDVNWTPGAEPAEFLLSPLISEQSPIRDMYEINPYTGVKRFWYHTVPNDSYFSPTVADMTQIQQKTEFTVYEDLLADILTTKYNKHEHYRPLPASQLNLTFNILPEKLLNNLYKTSNGVIDNVSVRITGMKLNIFTFNYGLLSIEPSPYYVPYYQEKSDVQSVMLIAPTVQDPEPATEVKLQTLKYNKMPPILLIYASEQTDPQVPGCFYQNLNTVEIEKMKLTINNDQGTALYTLTQQEMREMTVKNLGADWSNYRAMHGNAQQTTTICNGLEAIAEEWSEGQFAPQPGFRPMPWLMNSTTFRRITNPMGLMQRQSFLEGVYLLKLGEDIRIEPSMCGSINKPVSMTWEITFGNNYYDNATPTNKIAFNSVAFFPSYYLMNPATGLIKSQDFSIEDDTFWEMIANTNKQISEMKDGKNELKYSTEYPQLMMGSGWFSNLLGTVGTVASFIPHPIGTALGIGSKLLGKVVGDGVKKSKK